MSAAVEQVYFSSAILGLSIHEIACAGYFIMSKVITDQRQLKKAPFLLCMVTFVGVLSYTACTMAILHYKARGSTDPFVVQNNWFTTIAIVNLFG